MSMSISRAKYTGDPGLFGDIWGGIKGAVGGAARGFMGLQPQPPRPVAGPGSFPIMPMDPRTGEAVGPGGCRQIGGRPYARNQAGECVPGMTMARPGFGAAVERFLPGGGTGMMAAPMNGSAGGYHLNKSDYWLKSGVYVPAGTRWVKNRKRNPANARATSRAISRISGAKNYAKSLSRISIRKKC